MIKLNIISNNLKKELNLKSLYISIKNFILAVSALIFIYALILLLSKYILKSHFIDTVNQSTLVTSNIKNYNNQIKTINEQIEAITSIQDDYVAWSDLISYLSKNLDDGIKLKQLKIDGVNGNMQISGNADTRESLLKFKSSLENNKNIGNINFPIKNLLEKNNIDFEISAKIKNYEFE